jgi:hypothetical protein
VSVIAAIQYALFKDPNSSVFGGTDAARCTAAIRLPNNGTWSNRGWWAEAWSDWPFANSTANANPGGSINYLGTSSVELWGGDWQGVGSNQTNGRSTLRDNAHQIAPAGTLAGIRESQLFGTLIEARVRVPSTSTDCMYFLGLARSHATTSALEGPERLLGVVSIAGTSSWRAYSLRNLNPADGITPGVVLKDTSLGLTANVFTNFVIEISGGGESARWRAGTGAWTNTRIPVVTTATKSQILSRNGEGPVFWGTEVRETLATPVTPGYMRFTRLSIHAWRPGFVATKPQYRK